MMLNLLTKHSLHNNFPQILPRKKLIQKTKNYSKDIQYI